MPSEVEQWISALHREHLKPAGYRKTRHKFVRERDGYSEVFDIQGSAWNSRSQPWRFYLNVRVCFPGARDAIPARIGQLIDGAPEYFDLVHPEDAALASELTTLMDAASRWISTHIATIRPAVERGELWFRWS